MRTALQYNLGDHPELLERRDAIALAHYRLALKQFAFEGGDVSDLLDFEDLSTLYLQDVEMIRDYEAQQRADRSNKRK